MDRSLVHIHPDAIIGKNVVIDPFTAISSDVVIGDGTWIGSNVTIMEGARIGKNCKIFPGAVISAIPQDLKFQGEVTTAEIGDNTTIRECVTVNRGTVAANKTVVGDNCLLMAYVHIAHDCVVGNHCIFGNVTTLAGEVHVEDWAILSAFVAVHQFANIGGHVMISGGSLVRKDVPPFITVAHEPLTFAGLNSIGLRRRNFTSEKVTEIQEIYRLIYQSGLNNAQALERIENEFASTPEKEQIVNFIKNSKRGIIKGYTD